VADSLTDVQARVDQRAEAKGRNRNTETGELLVKGRWDAWVSRLSRPCMRRRPVLGFEATTSLSDMLDEVIPWIVAAVDGGRI
jgi:hypothetical protein